MSEAVFDRGAFLPDPFTEWYHGRPFQVAFVVSLLVHATLIVLVPGLRSVNIEPEQVISVEILMPEARPVTEPAQVPPAPTFTPPIPQQRPIEQRITRPQPIEPLPEPIVRQPTPELPPVARVELTPPVPRQRPLEQQLVRPQPIEPLPEPIVRQPEPELPPVARAELAPPVPRQEPRPEPLAVEPPLPRPEPTIAPTIEPTPAPQVVEPRIEPRPIAPRPQPQIQPRVEPRPEPALQPPMEVQPQLSQPVPPRPAPVAPTVSPPRPLEAIVAPPPDQPPPPSVAAVQPPPSLAAPVPPAPARPAIDETRLMQTYGTEISREIRRYQRYPVVAQRRGWEGTAEVTLRIAADGSVVSIELGKSSGREILDTEALNMVRRASPLPQAPDNLRGRELNVTVPIVFRLQDS